MKRMKFLVASVLFCAMGYVGYTAHAKMTMSEAEKFMQANIEALTNGETSGDTGTKYTCEDTLVAGNRLTRFCGSCTEVPNSKPSWLSFTKECTKR